MAAKKQRILYQSQTAKKPTPLYPKNNQWVNSIAGSYLQWKYNGEDIQASYELEVSTSKDFSNPITVSNVTAETRINLSDITEDTRSISASGIYYWRVKVTGITRTVQSDWSKSGVLNLDIDKPEIKGVDFIIPVGQDADGDAAAEIHANISFVNVPDGAMGYYIGREVNFVNVIDIRNDSDKVRTFFGQVQFLDLSNREIAQGHPYVEYVGSSAPKYWNIESKNLKFAVVLQKNERLTINFYNYKRTKYELHISDSDLYARSGQSATAYPSNYGNNEYSNEVLKSHIHIGGAETPPYTLKNRAFTLLDCHHTFIPFGLTNYIDNSSDNTVLVNIDRNSFKTNFDLSNIKAGDSIWFQRSYDAYQSNPKNTDSVLGSNSFGNSILRSWFGITNVDSTSKTLTLDNTFDSQYVNSKYPSESISPNQYKVFPSLNSGSYEVVENEIEYSDGSTKERKETIISDADALFQTEITDISSANPVGRNGISTRWLGVREYGTAGDFKFYPIYTSQDQQIKVIGDILSDFSSIDQTSQLEYYVTGDSFIITQNVISENLSNALVYIGATDADSGISSFALYKQTYNINSAEDTNGNDQEYITRTLPTSLSSMQWRAFNQFSPLDFALDTDSTVQEIFINVKDAAGNMAYDSFTAMPSQMCRSLRFSRALSDNSNPSGIFWINENDQNAVNITAVVDLYPLKENYGLDSFRLSSYPISLPKYSSPGMQDPGSLFMTWQKWTLGATYNCKVGEITQNEGSAFFTVKLSDLGEFSNLSFAKYDIIGCLAEFTDDPAAPKFSIVDLWSGNTLVLQGTKPETAVENSNIKIDTLRSSPSGGFNQGGLYSIYYNDKIDDFNSVSDVSKFNTIRYDREINFVDNSFASDLGITGAFSARWIGWFWSNYTGSYTVYARGIGTVTVDTEEYSGFKTLIPKTSLSPAIGETVAEITSSTLTLNKGWNRIKVEFASPNENGLIEVGFRSAIIDDIYRETVNGVSDWNLPVISSIDNDENTISLEYSNGETFDEYSINELASNWTVLGLLNANNGLALSDSSNSTNPFNPGSVALNDGATYIGINQGLGSETLYIDNTKSYFVQFVGDYPIYTLSSIDYSDDAATDPVSFLLLRDNHVKEIKNNGANNYRLAKGKLKILANTNNTITFQPVITGSWTSVSRVTSTIVLEDVTQNWESNSLEGLPIILDTDDESPKVYFVVSNTQNTITVNDADADESDFDGTDYRLGCVGDIVSVGEFCYTPIGQKKQAFSESQLVRNAAKIYVNATDYFGLNYQFMRAISLKGSNLDDANTISGSIIEFNLNTNRYSVYSVGDKVYDANETQEIVGIYESKPQSAPSGLLYWKTLSWDQQIPEGTSVEFYVKTAETEEGLKTATYNMDAFGTIYSPFTRADFNTPVESPTALDISRFSTDGTLDGFGRIKRMHWLQYKIHLISAEAEVTPTVDNIRITYTTADERIVYSNNFVTTSDVTQGILTGNIDVPDGTEIIFGISTNNDTNFNKYQIIPFDEAFDILEPNTQYRIAAKIRSSSTASPKIYGLVFMHNTESNLELLNKDL